MMKDRWNYVQHLAAEDLSREEMINLASQYRIGIKENLLPRGFYGELAHNYLMGKRRTRMQIGSFLKAYTMLEIPLTPTRLERILEPIHTSTDKSEKYREIQEEIINNFDSIELADELSDNLSKVDRNLLDKLDLYRLSTVKGRHGTNWTRGNKVNHIASSLMGSHPSDETIYTELLLGNVSDINGFPLTDILRVSQGSALDPRLWFNNTLCVVPKPGAAGRVIAKMNVWDQMCFIPYHDVMDKVLDQYQHFYHRDQ